MSNDFYLSDLDLTNFKYLFKQILLHILKGERMVNNNLQGKNQSERPSDI